MSGLKERYRQEIVPRMMELGGSRFVFTIPLVVFGIFRYLYLVYRMNAGADPAAAVLQDRPLLLTVAVWTVAVVLLLIWATIERGPV